MAESIVEQFSWLENVDFYNTTACNGSCADCMAYDMRKEEGVQHMDNELFFRVMDSLDGIDSVHFAGIGEPFMDPDIFEKMDYASERVKKEVRINTNGYVIPDAYGGMFWERKKRKEAKAFFERLPENTHIFFSFDKYHIRWMGAWDFYNRFCTLLEYSDLYDIDVSFNIRDTDKGSVFKNIILRYYEGLYYSTLRRKLLNRYQEIRNKVPITNRVLRMGKAKDMEGARYVDLSKLFENHIKKPMIGILHDGDVVSNFIVAYLLKLNRPEICELGNVNEEHLSKILEKYDRARSLHNTFRDFIFGSMIDNMGSYPFVIEDANKFDWDSDGLKDKKKEILENTPDSILETLYKFSKKSFPAAYTRLISVDGKLRMMLHEWITDEIRKIKCST